MSEKVVVPNKVYEQLESLRKSGAFNMMTEVEQGLEELGFEEALEWVRNNREKYSEGFFNGFVPESDS